jgi:hypothetical protein
VPQQLYRLRCEEKQAKDAFLEETAVRSRAAAGNYKVVERGDIAS